MTFWGSESVKRIASTLLAAILAITAILPATTLPARAADERELYLYYTHTKETLRIVYKRDGRFIPAALERLNVFLRDWRRNEPARMDPALFDLLWEAYRMAGASQPIHIVSAYRSPATNAMLASSSSGVADNSLHMQGKAIDFFIPGVPIARLREIGFRLQVGGVGYYPTSGSPFVHLDTGSVRAWPRMTTAQLREIFPDGRTLHVPSNGQVLSQQGYQFAQAEWQRCHRVPCSAGAGMDGSSVQVADSGPRRTLWYVLTGGNNSNSQPQAQQPAAPAPAPIAVAAAQPQPQPAAEPGVVAVAAVAPPTPPARPGDFGASAGPAVPETLPFQVIDAAEMARQVAMADSGETDEAPLPPAMSVALAELRATTPSAYAPTGGGTLDVASLQNAPAPTPAPVPQPRPQFAPAVIATVAPSAPTPIDPDTLPTGPSFGTDDLQAAAREQRDELAAFAALFEGVVLPDPEAPDAATANAVASLSVPDGELFAPDIEETGNALFAPASLTGEAATFTRSAALGETLWVYYDGGGNAANQP